MIFGSDLNIYAIVGILLLIGIVKKNAIMMIDFALEAQRNEGKPPGSRRSSGALCTTVPSDHDDDAGSVLQHASDCARARRGTIRASLSGLRLRRPGRIAAASRCI